MLPTGLYEQLINRIFKERLESLNKEKFVIKSVEVDKAQAANYLAHYVSQVIFSALGSITGTDAVHKQIELANKIIRLLIKELEEIDFEEDILETEGKMLVAVFESLDAPFTDIDEHLSRVTPKTRFSQSELFTGHAGLSLESEIKKEILSADQVSFLVSFIKWSGLRIFKDELEEFTASGRKLRVITTTYMGATDDKSLQYLSSLPNTEVKISYNADHERLHAKAYLFNRNSGFHTGYVGSSNISHSALSKGLEWNIKLTTKEVPHLIDKFRKTFDSYWESKDFEQFEWERDAQRFLSAVKSEKQVSEEPITFFEIEPRPYQLEILENLAAERETHNRYRNLVVAATGTGKTVVSAFDFKRFLKENPNAKFLYVAHRKEILVQSRRTFRTILRNQNFGELWVDGIEPTSNNALFASVQTIASRINDWNVSPTFYDYIIIDEVHHVPAKSYRPIIDYFKPKVFLGLTATPERMDQEDVLKDFCDTIAAEIRLPEALNNKLLCPFQYFGLSDSVDLRQVGWSSGKYQIGELTQLYTRNDIRVGEIIDGINKYVLDPHNVISLGFCASVEHAKFMARKFLLKGYKAAYLTSENSHERELLRGQLISKQINYLFVVDIFNEGVDIPEIDTVLFLRPTESLTIFLQQLGRGLRLSEGKECLTVLDFVGNARAEYDFEYKFRALVGKTQTSIVQELEEGFPHLPLGCSIVLEKQAKEVILRNIKAATTFSKASLVNKIINFRHHSILPLNLKNFLSTYHVPIQFIYKHGGWSRLCADAGQIKPFDEKFENEIVRAIKKKWLIAESLDYFKFIKELATKRFNVSLDKLSEEDRQKCLMLYFDVWQNPRMFNGLEESIRKIGENQVLVGEIIEVMDLLINQIKFLEYKIDLGYPQPLKIHGRYHRDQILAAFNVNQYESLGGAFGVGVFDVQDLKTELLFITLNKSEKDYSPSTLYKDYAINDVLFHWQSQNSSHESRGKGRSYIEHMKLGKKILLFVREKNEDEYKNPIGYVFLGEGIYKSHQGSRPMNIIWQLKTPLPMFLWRDVAKMAIG
jgi:superfamily II DNA or RNA helicase/HKD family nuclease